jgi:hypothetical protein
MGATVHRGALRARPPFAVEVAYRSRLFIRHLRRSVGPLRHAVVGLFDRIPCSMGLLPVPRSLQLSVLCVATPLLVMRPTGRTGRQPVGMRSSSS